MRTTVRTVKLLALIVWLGGLVFFAFVLAPTVFSPAVVERAHGLALPGAIVGSALGQMHWIGLVCGVLFSVCVLAHGLRGRMAKAELLAIVLMLLLTAFSQFSILPRMEADRRQVGEIDSVPADNPVRMRFDALHQLSERVEGLVMLCGIGLVVLVARERQPDTIERA